MGKVVYVEILGRRGQVLERSRLDRFPAYVGRAYSNDVILSDRYVSPRHAEIRESDDGEILVVDLESENGLRVVGGSASASTVTVRPGLQLRLGETTLRFASPDDEVPPAEPLTPRSRWLTTARNPWVALAAVLVALAVFVLDFFLGTYDDYGWIDIVGPALGALVLLAVWGAGWAFVSRLLTHRFDFLAHVGVVCAAALSVLALAPVGEYLEFFSSSHALRLSLLLVAEAFVLASMLFGHLSLLSVSSPRGRRLWSIGTTAVLFALGGLLVYAESTEFTTEVEVTAPLKSIGRGAVPTVSIDEFLEAAESTKEWVDAREES